MKDCRHFWLPDKKKIFVCGECGLSLEKYIKYLEKQNRVLEEHYQKEGIALIDMCLALKRKNAKYQEVLKDYADKKKWDCACGCNNPKKCYLNVKKPVNQNGYEPAQKVFKEKDK